MSLDYLSHSDHQLNPAKWFTERIELQMTEVQGELPQGERLVVRVLLADGTVMYPEWFGYHGPDMLVIEGKDQKGDWTRVLLSYTTAQLALAAVPAEEADRDRPPVGFQHE
jgi:hypothetical protein